MSPMALTGNLGGRRGSCYSQGVILRRWVRHKGGLDHYMAN